MPKSRGRTGRSHRRYIAKIRHDTNKLRRRARYSIAQGAQQYVLLMAILAQHGGEVVVTKGTIEQVGANLPNLGYTMVKGAAENEFIVRLLEGQPEHQVPALVYTDEGVEGQPSTVQATPAVTEAQDAVG